MKMNNRWRQKKKLFKRDYDSFIRYLVRILPEDFKNDIRLKIRSLRGNSNEHTETDEG